MNYDVYSACVVLMPIQAWLALYGGISNPCKLATKATVTYTCVL